MTWIGSYTGDSTYDNILGWALVCAAAAFVICWFVPSPYGRFASSKYGVSVGPRLGWFLMELPSTVSFLFFYVQGPRRSETVPLVFLAMWLIHYANRGFYFPFRIRAPRGQTATFGILVLASGWVVTGLHGYFHATYFSRLHEYTTDWLRDPRFILGFAIYYAGYFLNLQSDAILRNLRTREEVEAGTKTYRIPRGGLFRWVTNASYLSELIAWAGFAICTWSLAGVFILTISLANLVPRAFATQRWYRDKFPDYPADRKVLIPYVL